MAAPDRGRYPRALDLAVTIPLLLDAGGNALDLYEEAHIDDVVHVANTAIASGVVGALFRSAGRRTLAGGAHRRRCRDRRRNGLGADGVWRDASRGRRDGPDLRRHDGRPRRGCSYPVFESIDITGLTKVRPEPLRVLRFALDVHLGRLAAYLRLAGFDAEYRNDVGDADLAAMAAGGRVLLTRDQELLNAGGDSGLLAPFNGAEGPTGRSALSLRSVRGGSPFSRCLRCNGLLRPVRKTDVIAALPPRTRESFYDFVRCPCCHRIYWRGAHFEALRTLLERALDEAGATRAPAP